MVVIVHEPKRRKKAMLRKLSILLLLSAAAVSARVVVRLAPPPVIVETPAPRPGPAHVWTPGYYRWDGAAYVWFPAPGSSHPGRERDGYPRIGSADTADGCSSKDTGGNVRPAGTGRMRGHLRRRAGARSKLFTSDGRTCSTSEISPSVTCVA